MSVLYLQLVNVSLMNKKHTRWTQLFHLLDVIVLLQDRQGDSSTFQRGQTDVGGLCADHILTGQSPTELHLVNQSRGDQYSKCGILSLLTYNRQWILWIKVLILTIFMKSHPIFVVNIPSKIAI